MKNTILSIDTTSTAGSVAILKNFSLIAEIISLSTVTHSKRIMKMIDNCLKLSDIAIEDITTIAVTIGPGSFTGLRIGLSAAKGIASAREIPLIGIPSLYALASGIFLSDIPIYPVIDARREEVFFAKYKYENGNLKPETKENATSIKRMLAEIEESAIFVGDGAVKYKKEIKEKLGNLAKFAPEGFNAVRSSIVANIAAEELLSGTNKKSSNIGLNYIRKPDVRS